MREVFNNETGEYDFYPDEEESSPEDRPQRPAIILGAGPQPPRPKGEGLSQSEKNRRYRASHSEKHRQYHLDYMRKYRTKSG